MIVFLFKRSAQGVLVMLIISIIGFSIQSSLGDPVKQLLGEAASEQARSELREELGLNDSLILQYKRFISNALTGDLGNSYFYKEPALSVIFEKLPATIDLVFGATLLITLFSIPVGVYSAIKPNSLIAKTMMTISLFGLSIPVFLTGIFLIYLFAVILQWLPAYGRGDVVTLWGNWQTGYFTLDGIAHLVLPSLTLASIMLPLFVRLIRAEMLEVLQSEYIKFAYAKGLKSSRVWFLHALKNTMLPVITVAGVQIGIMLAYTILTETVFQWPGVGFMFLEAVNRSDTPLIVAYVVVVGAIFVLCNTLVDLLYGFINPTVRLARSSA